MHQEVVNVTRDDMTVLTGTSRLDRLRQSGANVVFLQPSPRRKVPAVLFMGDKPVVSDAKESMRQMLCEQEGKEVTLHPYDVIALHKPSRAGLLDLEKTSGCRIAMGRSSGDDDEKAKDPITQRRLPCLRLIGDPESQEHAHKLLEQRCKYLSLSEESDRWMRSFDPRSIGSKIELAEDGCVLRRIISEDSKEARRCKDCVAAGLGQMAPLALGSFFCVRVVKADDRKRFSEGLFLGVTSMPVEEPVPTLATRPKRSWVVGGGRVRGPDGIWESMPSARFDAVQEGTLVGLCVTRTGSIAAFSKAPAPTSTWECLLHWDAKMSQPDTVYALIEISGKVQEVQLEAAISPVEVERPVDVTTRPLPLVKAGGLMLTSR
eukprot:CAMPEP_0195071274 /NCGR_PEP_ID=MMETSP0448-20130528/15126_1 /TAXON_ID=66468 /ORGANISM="Heterocapsa triquestra, Strain CCMP 448" /LENGTH=375 /DNA_ID=CAMNT_0040103105 /DNA_START=39 /DNA_END=1166 /DNA_ORIENTATION=-